MEKNKNNFLFKEADTVFCQPNPNNIKSVAIIINHGCRSAAELMLLYFKQSSKVKTFGEPTAGAVDYLDMLTYKLPKTKYTLWVGTVKRELTKADGKYDNIGIKPDVEISDDVDDWVEFVRKYYEKN
jgi:C-terminal processing protease CtpA/Prc